MTSSDKTSSKLTRAQSRMARAASGWGVYEAERRAGVGANTVSRFETGTDAHGTTKQALRMAFEAAGATFNEDDGTGAGVRINEARPATGSALRD